MTSCEGEVPLPVLKREVYAQQRALLAVPAEAVKRAGYALNTGMEAKLERRRDVQARIRFLRRDDDDLIRRQRQQIEETLLGIINADILKYAKVKKGKIVAFDWDAIIESGMSHLLCELAPDSKLGAIPKLKLTDKLAALSKLMELHGFVAPRMLYRRATMAGRLDSW